jgi:hypothetical protein
VAWELIFMLLLLKIPLAYLCGVVWYAIKAEPTVDELPGDATSVREPVAPRPGKTGSDRILWRSPLRPARRPAGPRPSPAQLARTGGRR